MMGWPGQNQGFPMKFWRACNFETHPVLRVSLFPGTTLQNKKGNLGNPENSRLERENDEFQTGPSSGSMLGFPGCRRLSGKKQHTCWEHEKDFHIKFS